GFDVTTGKITWQFKSNADPGLADQSKPHVQVDDESVVLRNDRGALYVVNLHTGAASPATAATVGWCTTIGTYTVDRGDRQNPESEEDAGGFVAEPCKADGTRGGTPTHVPRN